MANALDSLFERPMISCPHCGTKNEEGSETCLCCGGRLETVPENTVPADPADGTDTQAQHDPAATGTVIVIGAPADDHGTKKAAPQKRLPG
ncbi:MAG: hypothetical protein IJY28_01565 [Clostridia bacterium]|nr:hypothetical protein [Clostridia bacterium]